MTINHVEAMSKWAKAKFKSMFGSSNCDMVADYFVEPEIEEKLLFPYLDSSYPAVSCSSMVKNRFFKTLK